MLPELRRCRLPIGLDGMPSHAVRSLSRPLGTTNVFGNPREDERPYHLEDDSLLNAAELH